MNENISNIDERLESASQRAVARMVSALPDESPSMVWRSGLNEAIRAQSARIQRRQRFFLVFRPAMGLSIACALVALVLMQPIRNAVLPERHQTPSATGSSLEASLFDLHRDDQRTMDVVGAGLNPNDPLTDQSRASTGDESEADLEL